MAILAFAIAVNGDSILSFNAACKSSNPADTKLASVKFEAKYSYPYE